MKRIYTLILIGLTFGVTNLTAQTKQKTIVLAIDGGGIKGVIPAVFLQEIEKRTGKQAFELFDVIGGTSTGGIISTALISRMPETKKPYSAKAIVDMYKNQGKMLFIPQHRDKDFLKAKYHASYHKEGIEPFLKNAFGEETTLSDAYNFIQGLDNVRLKQVFTTSYIMNSNGSAIKDPVRGKDYGPYLFNWYDASNDPGQDYFVWEAARGTSSAPVFFPIAHVGGGKEDRSGALEKWVVDGGTMSNNPSVWGVSEAFRTGAAKELKDIVVISIGTGFNPGSSGVGITDENWETPHDGNWGEFYWVIDHLHNMEGHKNNGGTIVNIMLESVQMAPNNQLSVLADAGQIQYFRLEPYLAPSQTAMDNTSSENIESLIKTAEAYLSSAEGKSILNDILNELEEL